MAKALQIDAQLRSQNGKAHARRMRLQQQRIPAVIYGAGEAPQTISLLHKDISLMLKNEAAYAQVLGINVDGQAQKAVLKAIQRHPYKPQIQHVDFLRVSAKEKLTMNVPLHFINEDQCPGIKAGGVLSKLMNELEIHCLPANLPEFIEVDLSPLELDHALHLTDVKLPSGVELTVQELDDEHNSPVVNIHLPRVEKEPEVEEAAEGEATAEKKEEGDKSANESDAAKE